VPWDCADGFFHAYWPRPHAYLRPEVRRASSVWARAGHAAEQRAVRKLSDGRGPWPGPAASASPPATSARYGLLGPARAGSG
jgi:hypothetical protein